MSKLTAIQRLRRLHQIFKGLNTFDAQDSQVKILQKLYFRHGLTLILTCSACPEQYDVYCGRDKVSYLRLRGGQFTAEYPDVMGELVLCEHPEGDGMFESYERFNYMCRALRAINQRIELIQ